MEQGNEFVKTIQVFLSNYDKIEMALLKIGQCSSTINLVSVSEYTNKIRSQVFEITNILTEMKMDTEGLIRHLFFSLCDHSQIGYKAYEMDIRSIVNHLLNYVTNNVNQPISDTSLSNTLDAIDYPPSPLILPESFSPSLLSYPRESPPPSMDPFRLCSSSYGENWNTFGSNRTSPDLLSHSMENITLPPLVSSTVSTTPLFKVLSQGSPTSPFVVQAAVTGKQELMASDPIMAGGKGLFHKSSINIPKRVEISAKTDDHHIKEESVESHKRSRLRNHDEDESYDELFSTADDVSQMRRKRGRPRKFDQDVYEGREERQSHNKPKWCHQCKARKKDVIQCCGEGKPRGANNQICYRAYCAKCLRKHYNEDYNEIRKKGKKWLCPGCRDACSCAACVRKRYSDPRDIPNSLQEKRNSRFFKTNTKLINELIS